MPPNLPTNITDNTPSPVTHADLHNDVNAAVNDHENRIVANTGAISQHTQEIATLDSRVDGHDADLAPLPGLINAATVATNANTADIADIEAELPYKEDKGLKGVANGYAALDGNGKVPAAQLPEQAAAGITSLNGDVTASGEGAVAATLASVTTAKTVGSSTQIPVITYDAKGRVINSTTAAVAGGGGIDGVGVPIGGTTGQILAKVDNTDYNTNWVDAPTGGGGGGGTWGGIIGDLTDQTDLQTALDDKASLGALALKADQADLDLTDAAVVTLQTDKASNVDLTAHTGNTSNPHAVTKAQVGLPDVDNTSDLAKPISTATQAALDDKASLAQLATKATPADITTAINGLVASAPGALDTLDELAAALGDDANFAATVTTSIATKANDADVVHDTGAETIAGVKTFSDSPLVPTPTTASQATPKSYVDALGVASIKKNMPVSGTPNGSTTNFTVPEAYVAGTLAVYLNGQRLFPGASNDYVEAASGFTMVYAPATGDVLSADYVTSSATNTRASDTIVSGITPTGTLNGTNTVFTLPSGYSTGTTRVFLDGVRQKITLDYTENATNGTITFVTAPVAGSIILVDYMIGSGFVSPGSNSLVTEAAVTGSVNGTNTSFTVANGAYVGNSLEVFINGLKQRRGVDYTETTPASGVFTMTVAPLTGDVVHVNYQFTVATAGNADTVDGYHASPTPTASTIPVLDSQGYMQAPVYTNYLINGGCQVAQRSLLGAINLALTTGFGHVDRFRVYAGGTAVTAGTITQGTGVSYAASGNTLRVSGATITGAGVLNVVQYVESNTAKGLANKTVSFSVRVNHDVGSNVNYQVQIVKPAVTADVYTSTTVVSTSGTVSVPSGTPSTIRVESIPLGDVSLGFCVFVIASPGAITTKTFDFTNFQLNVGSKVGTFVPEPYVDELNRCKRYYQIYKQPRMVGLSGAAGSFGGARLGMAIPEMLKVPTVSVVGSLLVFDGQQSNTINSYSVNYNTSTVIEYDIGFANAWSAGYGAIVTYQTGTTILTCDAEI